MYIVVYSFQSILTKSQKNASTHLEVKEFAEVRSEIEFEAIPCTRKSKTTNKEDGHHHIRSHSSYIDNLEGIQIFIYKIIIKLHSTDSDALIKLVKRNGLSIQF